MNNSCQMSRVLRDLETRLVHACMVGFHVINRSLIVKQSEGLYLDSYLTRARKFN